MAVHAPVDVVYLWVDGNDPAWRQKRRQAEARLCLGHGARLCSCTCLERRPA
ncbi:Stealth CR1 domain-containing protein [Rhodoferax sp.]|uniref:Stealth CR1 domain-containing protein n=1 Tax=Rhodoferax sp. TaxID=50421 RepID=UPI00345C0287